MRKAVFQAFIEHSYLSHSNKLSDHDKEIYNEYFEGLGGDDETFSKILLDSGYLTAPNIHKMLITFRAPNFEIRKEFGNIFDDYLRFAKNKEGSSFDDIQKICTNGGANPFFIAALLGDVVSFKKASKQCAEFAITSENKQILFDYAFMSGNFQIMNLVKKEYTDNSFDDFIDNDDGKMSFLKNFCLLTSVAAEDNFCDNMGKGGNIDFSPYRSLDQFLKYRVLHPESYVTINDECSYGYSEIAGESLGAILSFSALLCDITG